MDLKLAGKKTIKTIMLGLSKPKKRDKYLLQLGCH